MTTPLRLRCPSPDAVPAPEVLERMLTAEHHLVLEFPDDGSAVITATIARIAPFFPDCSVFCSAANSVTILRVIPRGLVLAHEEEILAAVHAFVRTCGDLHERFRAGTLSPEWVVFCHGTERCFSNRATGQTVEAKLWGAPRLEQVDPWFFALFVRSTPGFEGVSSLIQDGFHDAARILDIVFEGHVGPPDWREE